MAIYVKQGPVIIPVSGYTLKNGRMVPFVEGNLNPSPPVIQPPVDPPVTGVPNFEIMNSVLRISNQSGFTIENKKWDGFGSTCIEINNCSNFKIRRVWIAKTISDVQRDQVYWNQYYWNFRVPGYTNLKHPDYSPYYSPDSKLAIKLSYCSNWTIEDCYFDQVSTGVYAYRCTGGAILQNCEGRRFMGYFPRGQLIQFNEHDGNGIKIMYNYVSDTIIDAAPPANATRYQTSIGENGNSRNPEDLVNMFAVGTPQTSGASSRNIEIAYNYLRGGGPSNSGGGIILGDGGSRFVLANARVHHNVLVNPGQYGIAILAGYDNTVEENLIFQKGYHFSNIAMYAGNSIGYFYGSGNKLINNKTNWKSRSGVFNNIYLYPNASGITNVTGNEHASAAAYEGMPAPVGCGIKSWSGPLTT